MRMRTDNVSSSDAKVVTTPALMRRLGLIAELIALHQLDLATSMVQPKPPSFFGRHRNQSMNQQPHALN